MKFIFSLIIISLLVSFYIWNPFVSSITKFKESSRDLALCRSEQELPSQCLSEEKDRLKLMYKAKIDGFTDQQIYAAQDLGQFNVTKNESRYEKVRSFYGRFSALDQVNLTDEDYKIYSKSLCSEKTYVPKIPTALELDYLATLGKESAVSYVVSDIVSNPSLTSLQLTDFDAENNLLKFKPNKNSCLSMFGNPSISKETFYRLYQSYEGPVSVTLDFSELNKVYRVSSEYF